MQKKIGTYICTGCSIGESLDIEALSTKISEEYQITTCKKHNFLCGEKGIEFLNNEIKNSKLDAVVIAACSPRVNIEIFSFDKNIQLERVNLREQVVWSHEPNNENTQMLAEDYLRMGIVKIEKTKIPTPYIIDEINSDILVIGGGITGITAAIEGANAGYNIILLEKEAKLGGFANNLYKQLPQKPPYKQLEEPNINEKILELEKLALQGSVNILKSAEINEISGQPGMFEISVNQNNTEIKLKSASIVMATGWKLYDANKIIKELEEKSKQKTYDTEKSKLEAGKTFKNIITNIELEKFAKNGQITRPSDNKKAENVLFIQCAGSRDKNHLPYCSSYCCATSLKQAKYIREFNKNANVFVLYKDVRTPGKMEIFYKEMQNDEQIFMTKGEVSNFEEDENGNLIVEIEGSLIDKKIRLKLDLVVLAIGMTPANTEDLNLTYRQGKGLPELKYNFPDSHFICFPYETRRTGIYAAGTLRTPGDMTSCIEDARGATLKAIQTLEATKRGEAVHPRSGDMSFPEIYFDRCTDCKRCTEECPFGTYDENEKGTPIPNPTRCRSCGICLGACPERVISFEDYTIDSVSSMIKAIEIPDEFEEKPRILAFVCENDAYPAIDMAGFKRLKYSAFVRFIPVRCIGSVNKVWLSDALSQGFDGIMQIGCKPGDDYQCHFITGSELMETRAENMQETFQTMMLEPERLKTVFIEINEYNKIPEIINDYVEEIEELEPNPFKDM